MTACAGWTAATGAAAGLCTPGFNDGGEASCVSAKGSGGGASAAAAVVALGGFEDFFLLGAGACTGASSALMAFHSAEIDAPSATRSSGSTSAVARASRMVVESEGLATAASRIDAEGGGRGSEDIFCFLERRLRAGTLLSLSPATTRTRRSSSAER